MSLDGRIFDEYAIGELNETGSVELYDLSDIDIGAGSLEQFRDSDGTLHIKTVFTHNDAAEDEVWEIFSSSDDSSALELLLDTQI